LPTATAVGHDGSDLVIDALASVSHGTAVENPRQIPSYRYARRYGPRPPWFSRATLLPGTQGRPDEILVGGTASVVGQDSAHPHDLDAQIRETLANLSGLIRSVFSVADSAAILRNFKELRVYYPRPGDEAIIRDAIAAAFPAVSSPEFIRADLCRRELLVEIEGVASCLSRENDAAASHRPSDRAGEQIA
jgi:enamine deaminase RidA (YjgF/YER057c/UK114 family)